MYTVCKVRFWDVFKLIKVANILYDCGKNMAKKYDLHHWDNSRFKNLIIIVWCVLKNNVFLVCDGKDPISTFQTRKVKESYLFQKLATSPKFESRGVGTFCLNEIERFAKMENCKEVICEVYDKSEHAKAFYENRGYVVCGYTNTLKYGELKLQKKL